MNGREELQGVLSLVDMTKVDLPSYNISIKKYDIIAKTYTKVIYLLALLELRVNKQENPEEEKRFNIAKRTIVKIANDPLVYCYENAVQKENALIKQATSDIYGSRIPENSPHLRNVQNSVKKSLMIKNMKEMLNLLKQFVENNAENVIEFCMSDENFEEQINIFKQVQNNGNVHSTEESNHGNTVENENTINESQSEEKVCVPEKKVSFLKRLFGKK